MQIVNLIPIPRSFLISPEVSSRVSSFLSENSIHHRNPVFTVLNYIINRHFREQPSLESQRNGKDGPGAFPSRGAFFASDSNDRHSGLITRFRAVSSGDLGGAEEKSTRMDDDCRKI